MITIGTDAEVFLKIPGRDIFIASCGKVGGTKQKPIPLFDPHRPGFFIQEDNVTVEFNTPYSDSPDMFRQYVKEALDRVQEVARDLRLEISLVPYAEFEDEQLDSEQAKTFGCDRDYNVWTLHLNPRPNPKLAGNARTAAGHIHIGGPDLKDPVGLGRWMDLVVGCPSIMFDPDTRRRRLYGMAGSIRKKPEYPGIEYRVLGNWWLTGTFPKMVAELSLDAVNRWRRGDRIPDEAGKRIAYCINNADMETLKGLTKDYNLKY